jgi:UrcA family protein
MNTPARICSILIICSLAGTAYAADLAAPAQAGKEGSEPVAMKFHYDVHELTTPEGASRVYRMILVAARRHCTFQGSLLTELRSVDKRCMTDLVEKAVTQAGSVQLAELHRGMERVDITARR